MKLNSLFSAIIFSLVALALSADNQALEFYYTGSDNVVAIENQLQYQISPLAGSIINIRGLSANEKRINFNQNSRKTLLELDYVIGKNILRHRFLSGFEYLYDHSDLEQELSPYVNKTAFLGYGIDIEPVDSIALSIGLKGYMRKEQDRYLMENTLSSDGFQAFGGARFSAQIKATDFGIHFNADKKKLDWEHFDYAGAAVYLNHYNDILYLQNNLSINHRKDDLYVLTRNPEPRSPSNYELSDVQVRSALSYNGFVELIPSDYLRLTLQEHFSQRLTELEQNIVRNNGDYLNQAALNLEVYLASGFSLQSRFQHSYAIKDFSFSRNTRHTENRGFNSVLAYEYKPGDSLSVAVSFDLQRTSFPDDEHRWDNDLLSRNFRIGNVHYYKERIRLGTWLSWNIQDDVYIDGVLSSNNKQINSISLLPECDILLGDRVLFKQSYQIRADYTGYMYEGKDRSIYRQLGYRYNLIFDSFPLIARSGDRRWLDLPYRGTGTNALMTDLFYAYEQNEYGDMMNTGIYSIDFKTKRYSTGFTIKHDIQNLYYIIEPKYSWGSWTEYSLLLGAAWQFNNLSLLEISVNPVGDSLDTLDWRTSANLNLRF